MPKKKPALDTSRRGELPEDVWFGIGTGTLLGCRAIDLGKPPQGGVIYLIVHGTTTVTFLRSMHNTISDKKKKKKIGRISGARHGRVAPTCLCPHLRLQLYQVVCFPLYLTQEQRIFREKNEKKSSLTRRTKNVAKNVAWVYDVSHPEQYCGNTPFSMATTQ